MNQRLFLVLLISLLLFNVQFAFGQDEPTPASTSVSTTDSGTDSSKFITEKQKLELEKMKLENEKLQLELNQIKSQAIQAPTPVPTKKEKADKAEIEAFQLDESKKAEALAKDNKDKEDLLILDLVNSEVWFKGTRYSLHEVNNLVTDQGWKMSKKIEAYSSWGRPRRLYVYQNLTLLKYDGNEKGIVTLSQPQKAGDLRFLTTNNISFDSKSSEVRDSFPNLFYKFDGQGEKDKQKVLKYNHSRGLSFDDRIEVLFDQQDKMTEIRCGVLGER